MKGLPNPDICQDAFLVAFPGVGCELNALLRYGRLREVQSWVA